MERKDFKVWTNTKFLVKLGWKGTEIVQALQTVYKDDAPKKLVFTSGLRDFEMVEKLLKMMRFVEDQQPQKIRKKLILLET